MSLLRVAAVIGVVAVGWAGAAALVVAWNHAVTTNEEHRRLAARERLHPSILPRSLP